MSHSETLRKLVETWGLSQVKEELKRIEFVQEDSSQPFASSEVTQLRRLKYSARQLAQLPEPPETPDRWIPPITKNAAKCRLCGDVIESRHRHDFVTCRCGEIFVDGGKDYIRRGARNLENLIGLDEHEE